jgi:hypothetical protein
VKHLASAFAAFALVACSSAENETENEFAPEFGLGLADQAINGVQAAFGPSNVLVVCGPSVGRGVEIDGRSNAAWAADSIKSGRTAFVWDAGSAPDVLFRDAGGAWISATQDGGDVRVITDDTGAEEQVWTIVYEKTGVVESHNIVRSDVGLVDIFTSNKPSVFGRMSPSIGSAKIFLSNCVRP